jgi:predicted amidophosphoribosyltransferase
VKQCPKDSSHWVNIISDDKYCPECGTATVPRPNITCGKCNAKVGRYDAFCGSCGSPTGHKTLAGTV